MDDFFKRIKCSLGIFAHNEEKNIGKLLEAILNQKLNQVEIEEIFMVCDGCTDRTVPIVEEFAKNDRRIKVLVQEKRGGKASIVNLFLKVAKNEILVMESADTLPEKNTVENLVKPFSDQKVGMVGVRPVPVDNPKTFMGYTAHLLWELHHQISLEEPKMGEMVAFRNIIKEIPSTAVDEAYIEGFIKNKGYKVIYQPDAIVYNKGPETISDFLRQRRRIYWGHLDLKEKTGYRVSTTGSFKTLFLILKSIEADLRGFKRGLPRKIFYLPGAIFLEALGRFLGWWDYKLKKKNHIVWDMATSTKDLSKEKP